MWSFTHLHMLYLHKTYRAIHPLYIGVVVMKPIFFSLNFVYMCTGVQVHMYTKERSDNHANPRYYRLSCHSFSIFKCNFSTYNRNIISHNRTFNSVLNWCLLPILYSP